MEPSFKFKAELFIWQGKGAWYFIRVPIDVSKEIKSFSGPKRGFGSVKVLVKIGTTSWKTSVFPEKEGTYLLPVKAEVRKKECLEAGMNIDLSLTLQTL